MLQLAPSCSCAKSAVGLRLSPSYFSALEPQALGADSAERHTRWDGFYLRQLIFASQARLCIRQDRVCHAQTNSLHSDRCCHVGQSSFCNLSALYGRPWTLTGYEVEDEDR